MPTSHGCGQADGNGDDDDAGMNQKPHQGIPLQAEGRAVRI